MVTAKIMMRTHCVMSNLRDVLEVVQLIPRVSKKGVILKHWNVPIEEILGISRFKFSLPDI